MQVNNSGFSIFMLIDYCSEIYLTQSWMLVLDCSTVDRHKYKCDSRADFSHFCYWTSDHTVIQRLDLFPQTSSHNDSWNGKDKPLSTDDQMPPPLNPAEITVHISGLNQANKLVKKVVIRLLFAKVNHLRGFTRK